MQRGKGALKWTLGITQAAFPSFYKRKNIISWNKQNKWHNKDIKPIHK